MRYGTNKEKNHVSPLPIISAPPHVRGGAEMIGKGETWHTKEEDSAASILRKSCLVTTRQLSIHGNVGASFWWSDTPTSSDKGRNQRSARAGF